MCAAVSAKVLGYDRNLDSMQEALNSGIIDRISPDLAAAVQGRRSWWIISGTHSGGPAVLQEKLHRIWLPMR